MTMIELSFSMSSVFSWQMSMLLIISDDTPVGSCKG